MPQQMNRRTLLRSAGLLAATAAAPVRAESQPSASASPESARSRAGPRKFDLGLVTYNLAADWDLTALIERCRAAKFAAVEFRTTHAHGVEPSLSKTQRDEVKKRCLDAGLVIWGLGTTCEFHSPDPAVVSKNITECRRFIELAVDIGAKGVKVRPNALPDAVPVEKTIDQIGTSLRACGQAAADSGIEIWCEVHGNKSSAPPIMRKIMDAADHPKVGLTWNCNASDLVSRSIRESFELLATKIFSCHINELIGPYPHRELFALLAARGYDRYTLMEVPPLRTKDAGDLVRFMRYYRSLWEEMSRPA